MKELSVLQDAQVRNRFVPTTFNFRENNPMHSRKGLIPKGNFSLKSYPAAGSTLSGDAPHGRSADASPIKRPWM